MNTPPNAFVVRAARPEDAEVLQTLITLLAAHHGDTASVDAATLRADLFGPQPWAKAIVAEGAGTLLGYALLVRLYRAQFTRRSLDLHHLFVVSEARGIGVGRALIGAAVGDAAAQGCDRLVVGTHPGNLQAQAYYRTIGFEDVAPGGPRFRLLLDEHRGASRA